MGAGNFAKGANQLWLIFGQPLHHPTKRVAEPFRVDRASLCASSPLRFQLFLELFEEGSRVLT